MARTIGTPGESATARAVLLTVVVPLLLIIFVGLPSVYALVYMGNRAGLAGLILMTLILAVMMYTRRDIFPETAELMREGVNYFKGARGEILVHQELVHLPNEYIVFHDFHPVDSKTGDRASWNVDHIVVGPTGVFVLDAKYYGNTRVPSAAASRHSANNVKQAQRNALDLKNGLVRWSAGDLAQLFVVPIVVYAQPDAHMDSLREGVVRTLPLRLLLREITSHGDAAIDQEKAGRIARVLFSQISSDLQGSFRREFEAYGQLSKAALYAARDARLAAQAASAGGEGNSAEIPSVCPRCGGALVRRVARYGDRVGKPFLGCANYSKTGCRYGFNLEE